MTESIKIVPKVWGEEHWIVNKEYCGKKLLLKKGYRCSTHYHKKKDETFYVIKGRVLMELGLKRWVMNVFDSVHIPIGAKHRFTGLDDSEIIEFSTHHEEQDSHRVSESEKIPDNDFKVILQEYPS